MLLGTELCLLLHLYVQVLMLRPLECNLICRWGLCRSYQEKMRPLGWALNQDDCPCENGQFGDGPTHRKNVI